MLASPCECCGAARTLPTYTSRYCRTCFWTCEVKPCGAPQIAPGDVCPACGVHDILLEQEVEQGHCARCAIAVRKIQEAKDDRRLDEDVAEAIASIRTAIQSER